MDQDGLEPTSPELELLYQAWAVIANAGWEGMAKSPGWQEAAVRWRDDFHALLARRSGQKPAAGTS
jgi:hypothetical protein